MRVPFVVRVPTPDLAEQLRLALAQEPARVEVEPATSAVTVGVADAHGPPRWLAPLPSGQADDVLAFLARWGFIGRASGALRA